MVRGRVVPQVGGHGARALIPGGTVLYGFGGWSLPTAGIVHTFSFEDPEDKVLLPQNGDRWGIGDTLTPESGLAGAGAGLDPFIRMNG